MRNSDIEYLMKFARASCATLIIAGCSTGCLYGPAPSDQQWYNPDAYGPELESMPIPSDSNGIQDADNDNSADNDD